MAVNSSASSSGREEKIKSSCRRWGEDQQSPEVAAAALVAAAPRAERPPEAGCNGCCSSLGPAETATGSPSGGDPSREGASPSRPRWKARKLSWVLGAGWLALLLALGIRLVRSAAGREEAEEGREGEAEAATVAAAAAPSQDLPSPGGPCWPPPLLPPGSALCCCLLAVSFCLGWDLLRAGVRLRTPALLLAACGGGEALARLALAFGEEDRLPAAVAAPGLVLGCLAGGTWLALRRRLRHGVLLIAWTSGLRLTSLASWESARAAPWGPYLAYLLGLLGILLAGYEDLEGADSAAPAPAAAGAARPAKAEVPALKRRRRSSSMIAVEMAGCGSKSHRRTSLPCIPREQVRGGWGSNRQPSAFQASCITKDEA
uniref:Uncharacterized protein n=1 Tax=Salvator merianae TaxID=96440 RepID=A0A8D0BN00_SALMN